MSPYDSNTLVGPIAVVDVFWAEIADSIGAMEQVEIQRLFTCGADRCTCFLCSYSSSVIVQMTISGPCMREQEREVRTENWVRT